MTDSRGLTVLIATFNGAGTLERTLPAFERLVPPPGGWRMVVIDNASTDATPEVLARFADRLPLTVKRIEQQGKNLALNAGLELVVGDLVVFSDDDTIPDPQWLVALRSAADEQPAFDVFGGTIQPVWPSPPPAWVLSEVNLGATFAITPPDTASGPIPAAQVWGPNMAVRRRVFDAGHRFDASVGPAQGQYIMGSEVEFTCRVERAGHPAWFTDQAMVGHIIRPAQMQPAWIIRRAYRLGRHMFHQERDRLGADVPRLMGAPRWKFRQLAQQVLQGLAARLRGDFEALFRARWEASLLRGYLYEARRNRAQEP